MIQDERTTTRGPRLDSPIDRLTCLDHSMGYLIRVFHVTYACVCKTFAKRCIHTGMWPRLTGVSASRRQPLHTTDSSASEKAILRCGLKPFGVAHGVGRREVKVVGRHFCRCPLQGYRWGWSSLVGKVVHPCRVKSFRKAVFAVMNDLESDA